MSRTYLQWRSAYNEWKANYYEGINSLQPDPHASVVYTERSKNPYWATRQDKTEDSISLSMLSVSENLPELSIIAQHLIDIGQAEFNKEMRLLKQLMPDLAIDTSAGELDFIKQFNIFLQGKTHYETMINRLDKVLNQNKKQKNFAPIVSSLYAQYLATALNQNIIPLLRQFDATTSIDTWDSMYQAAVDKSITQAFERMLQPQGHKNNEIFGHASEFTEILALWRNDPLLQTQFRDTIRSKIDFNKILNALQTNKTWQERARQGKKVGMRAKLIDSAGGLNLKSNKRTGQIGGSVYEYIQNLFRNTNLNATISENGTQISGQVISGEALRTDSILILGEETTINFDADALATELNEDLSSAASLLDARDKIQAFYERNLKSLNQGFIIYDSAKAYGTSVNEKGFKDGKSLPLERLGDYASDAGIPLGSIHDFILTAYNTLPGAIYDVARGEVQEAIENILYAATAKLMFDDWTTIGEGTGVGSNITALHVFPLSGIYVPASYLFTKIGQALANADTNYRQYVNIHVKLPSTKTYEPRDGTGMPPDRLIGKNGSHSDLEIKKQILEEWNKQFRQAQTESEFTIHFLRNFNSLISDLAKI